MAWPYLAIAYASVGAFGTFVHSLPLVVWICLCCVFTTAVLALVWRKDTEASRLRAGEFPDSSDHINGSSAVKRFGAIALLILLALGYFWAIPKQAESVEENRLARAESPSSAEANRPATKEPTTRLNPPSRVSLANATKNSPEASNAVSDESKLAESHRPNTDGIRFCGSSGGLLSYFSDNLKDVAKEVFESIKDLGELRVCQPVAIPLSEDWSIQREIWVESGIDIEIIL